MEILVDQGLKDPYMVDQLKPSLLEKACENSVYSLDLCYHPDYDHGYTFINSFMEKHLDYHLHKLISC